MTSTFDQFLEQHQNNRRVQRDALRARDNTTLAFINEYVADLKKSQLLSEIGIEFRQATEVAVLILLKGKVFGLQVVPEGLKAANKTFEFNSLQSDDAKELKSKINQHFVEFFDL